MFWAITCEAGKRYSQIPPDPFRVTMAALEPRESLPENKQVTLMLEQKGKEFLLCTLEYDKVMQVNLGLQFNEGEETFFFVNGEGTVHLSGHLLRKNEALEDYASSNGLSKRQTTSSQCEDDEEEEEDEEEEDDDEEEDDEEDDDEGTHRLLNLDDSDEEDSEDWNPEMELKRKSRSLSRKRDVNDEEVEVVDGEDSDVQMVDSEAETTDDDVDEEDKDFESDESEDIKEDIDSDEVVMDEKRKRKKSADISSAKRAKKDVTPMSKKKPCFEGVDSTIKKKKRLGFKERNSVAGSSKDNYESEEDEMDSCIAKTPMPAKNSWLNSPKVRSVGSGSSPSLKSAASTSERSKKEGKVLEKSAKGDKALRANEVKYSNVLPSGVEYEDIRIGDGALAKPGKIVHVYYVGKFEKDNRVFESRKPGSNKPFSFRLGRQEVILGWDDGIKGMRVGGRRKIRIPPSKESSSKKNGPVEEKNTLLFTIDLVSIS